MIKTVVKKHPLRDIILDFDDAVQPPEFETTALNYFYEAHDKTWALKEHALKQTATLQKVDDMLEDLTIRRLGIEQDLDFLEEALGISTLDEDIVVTESFTIDINDFFQATIRHNADLQDIYQYIDALTATYNIDVENIFEDDYLIDPMYFDVLHDLYQRYEELSVDTVSLDDDHQDFLGAYGDVDKLYFNYIDHAQVVFEKYRTVLNSSEAMYRRIEFVHEKMNEKTRLDGMGGSSLN